MNVAHTSFTIGNKRHDAHVLCMVSYTLHRKNQALGRASKFEKFLSIEQVSIWLKHYYVARFLFLDPILLIFSILGSILL